VVVGGNKLSPASDEKVAEVEQRIADLQRFRLPLRITVRQTEDGLGISIPPQRSVPLVGFLLVWLAGWSFGMRFGLASVSTFRMPDLLFLIWSIPWTASGLAVLYVALWQLFGREQLFFTAGALVREWWMPGLRRRRVVMGSEIREVTVKRPENDLAGLGTIQVKTATGSFWIGSGLGHHEAELVADLIREQAVS
jgi:hypothetical protein